MTVSQDLVGRTIVVTGANSGIGRATSELLLQRGAHVVLLCRRSEAGQQTCEALASLPGSTSLVVADLSDPTSIARAADHIAASHPRLDALINNAGIYLPRRRETVDGLEATFAINHLGPFRLTRRLLPLLWPGGRVVVLASRSHREGALDLDDLQRQHRPYWGYGAYADSKLANILFVRELARRAPEVVANAVHPGVVRTGFARDEPGWLHSLIRIGRLFMPGPHVGARGPVHLASAPEAATISGRYFSGTREKTPSRHARDAEVARRLWEISEALSPALPPM